LKPARARRPGRIKGIGSPTSDRGHREWSRRLPADRRGKNLTRRILSAATKVSDEVRVRLYDGGKTPGYYV
jgi:hypothetical protein